MPPSFGGYLTAAVRRPQCVTTVQRDFRKQALADADIVIERLALTKVSRSCHSSLPLSDLLSNTLQPEPTGRANLPRLLRRVAPCLAGEGAAEDKG